VPFVPAGQGQNGKASLVAVGPSGRAKAGRMKGLEHGLFGIEFGKGQS
jgi:hypothetical protein